MQCLMYIVKGTNKHMMFTVGLGNITIYIISLIKSNITKDQCIVYALCNHYLFVFLLFSVHGGV